MSDAFQEIRNAIDRAGGLRSVRVGPTLFMFTESERVKALAKAHAMAMRTGHAVEDGGTRIFYDWSEVWEPGPDGKMDYQWHRDGERVLQELYRVTVDREGNTSKAVVKRAYRKMEQ